MNQTSIYLEKRGKVLAGVAPKLLSISAFAATADRNFHGLGYAMSPSLLGALSALPESEALRLYDDIGATLRRLVGAHVQWAPMYPNFPRQVMEAPDLELYLNAMTHYWVAAVGDILSVPARWLPQYEKERRAKLPAEDVALKIIALGDEAGFGAIFTDLAGANIAPSDADKEILRWFAASGRELRLPPSIPQKETLAVLVGAYLRIGRGDELLPHLRTATDVLRAAAALSGGDVSLATSTKLRRFGRPERRLLLAAIEGVPFATEDMLRRPEMFKRLARELRPGDYAERFPKAAAAFKVVLDGAPFETFGGRVEKALAERDTKAAVTVLQGRPGDFARRLDHVVRGATPGAAKRAVSAFLSVADDVSTPVLLQAFAHFLDRDTPADWRAFFPKGSLAKVHVGTPLAPLDANLAGEVAFGIREALVRRFSKLPALGPSWVDPALETQYIPFGRRSASRSLRTAGRGSRFAIAADTVRLFAWWKDGDSRTDIDLSAAFLDSDFRLAGTVSYYNLREVGGHHSGDITSAPQGACEFVDLDLARLSGRTPYVAMVVTCFTGQKFATLPCFVGWMGRSKPQSGEVFDPRTVADRFDLASEATVSVPLLLDIEARQVVWADLAMGRGGLFDNVHRRQGGISAAARAVARMRRPTFRDLFEMHVEARGRSVDRDKAKTVFGLREGITPFDEEVLRSYLG